MQFASTTPIRYKSVLASFVLLLTASTVSAQDNSPYSRYGLGTQFPRTNIINRGMGGVSAGYAGTYLGYAALQQELNTVRRDSMAFTEALTVNYNNPASYSAFQANMEQRSGKVSSARVILDVGVNFSNRRLTEPNTPRSFTSSDLLFSHVYVGIPIRRNWGLAFGLRPLTRISYNIVRTERLSNIDSVGTQFTGTGGSFLPSIGTGYGIGNLSLGVNMGYLFGKKEITTRRVFINDSIQYAASNHTTNTSFGNLFFNAGLQYKIELTRNSLLRLGFSGNWKQTLDGEQDILRQTYVRASSGEELRVDSVFQQSAVTGEIVYPASYTAGFMFDQAAGEKTRGWSLGADYATSQWSEYRFFGATDAVRNSWEMRIGGSLNPVKRATRYGQAITWRAGGHFGKDFVAVDNSLPTFGVSFGVGLPLFNYNPAARSQYSVLNLAVEYNKLGNGENRIREDLFRLSIGLNFTDLWFGKRRYD